MRLIYLTGMPGSGKSTLGKMLAERLNCDYIDLDETIETEAGAGIPELFEREGESGFRDRESRALKAVSQREESAVIATGGGIILREENWETMRDSGMVFFIDRPLATICKDVETGYRPLLKGGIPALTELYEKRIRLYNERCHVRISNGGSAEEALAALLAQVKNLS